MSLSKSISYILLPLLFIFCAELSFAQKRKSVTYSRTYDQPKDINKLYIKLQPIYGELFSTNSTAGIGLEVEYYLTNKVNFIANIRLPYAKSFDKERDHALKMDTNEPKIKYDNFTQAEFGITYHIKDVIKEKDLKMILINNHQLKERGKLTSVANHILVPAKLRKVFGARLGTYYYKTTLSLSNSLKNQELELSPVSQNKSIPNLNDTTDAFVNFSSTGLYAGLSISWIRNVIVETNKRYGNLADNSILDLYLDFLYSPSLAFGDLFYEGNEYSTEEIKTNPLGMRLGLMNKHSHTLSWGYGVEMGYKPGIEGRGFYALLKFSFPVFSTDLKAEIEAYGE